MAEKRFVWRLLCHLEFFGVDLSTVVIQTDNGGEFIGSVYSKQDSGFTELVERVFGGIHQTIPVATPRFNGAVENFHAFLILRLLLAYGKKKAC